MQLLRVFLPLRDRRLKVRRPKSSILAGRSSLTGLVLFSVSLLVSLSTSAVSPPRETAEDRPALYKPAAARYGEFARSSLYLTMRDGVKIAVDTTLPATLPPGEKIPTILVQTRYWRSFAHRPNQAASDLQRYGRYADYKKLFLGAPGTAV